MPTRDWQDRKFYGTSYIMQKKYGTCNLSSCKPYEITESLLMVSCLITSPAKLSVP
jgi:Tfp pilus assembly protein PilZ